MDEEAFEDLLAANRIPRKGQELFWTGKTHPMPAYLDECSNDSVMSSSSRLDESQAKLGEIADRLDSFFCEDDPILLPSSTLSTSDKFSSESNPHKKRSRRQSSNGTKRRSKDSVTSDSGTGKKNIFLYELLEATSLINFHTFSKFVIALLKRNQISAPPIRKSDFRTTPHEEII